MLKYLSEIQLESMTYRKSFKWLCHLFSKQDFEGPTESCFNKY